MAFSPDTSGGFSWSELRSISSVDEAWIPPILQGLKIGTLTELGPGNGLRAAALLRQFKEMEYRGFEPSTELLNRAREAVAVYAERASVEGRNLAIQLPIPDASQDLILCLDLLEYLRMDQLYMVLAEARRVLKPGGLCLLRCLNPGSGPRAWIAGKALALFPRLFGGKHPLELNHYISPEDWKVVSDRNALSGWLSRQTAVLERL